MSQPQVPKHQPMAWQPTISSSDSDYSDEQQAAQQYDGYYGGSPNTSGSGDSGSSSSPGGPYQVPTLKMAYTKAPDLIPLTNTGSGGSSGPTVSESFSVELGELMTAESTCLGAVSTAVDDYETLADAVNNAISSPSLFGQTVGANPPSGMVWNGNVSYSFPADDADTDPLDTEGIDFAQSINPQMQQLLQAVANGIESMGTFAALLNNAAQMYTDADAQSAFPPASLMQGRTNEPPTGVTPPPTSGG